MTYMGWYAGKNGLSDISGVGSLAALPTRLRSNRGTHGAYPDDQLIQ